MSDSEGFHGMQWHTDTACMCCPVRTRQRHTARWMLRVIDSCRTRHVAGANVSTRTYLNRSCFWLFPEIWFPRRIYLCVYMNNSSRTGMCCLLSLRVDNLRRSLAVYSNRQLLHWVRAAHSWPISATMDVPLWHMRYEALIKRIDMCRAFLSSETGVMFLSSVEGS